LLSIAAKLGILIGDDDFKVIWFNAILILGEVLLLVDDDGFLFALGVYT
jgi:hypothetical protein